MVRCRHSSSTASRSPFPPGEGIMRYSSLQTPIYRTTEENRYTHSFKSFIWIYGAEKRKEVVSLRKCFVKLHRRKEKTVIPSQCAHWRGNPFSLKNATNMNISGWETDCHTSDIGHWFAMTVLLFVQFYFSETDPYPYFLRYFAVRTGTGVFPASARIQKPMPMSPARARLIML